MRDTFGLSHDLPNCVLHPWEQKAPFVNKRAPPLGAQSVWRPCASLCQMQPNSVGMSMHVQKASDMSCDFPLKVLHAKEQKAPFNCGRTHPLAAQSVGGPCASLNQMHPNSMGVLFTYRHAFPQGCNLPHSPQPTLALLRCVARAHHTHTHGGTMS